ncbi:MAG: aspartate carbamoyltransferase regulatory subunit, partial [Euryarchaeota archaeon]|nr:aspartate carbamoyltransferase regulatory subunit [Euryarchaeota archaeon]
TNTDEPVVTRFYVIENEPLILRCYHCERIMDEVEVESQF